MHWTPILLIPVPAVFYGHAALEANSEIFLPAPANRLVQSSALSVAQLPMKVFTVQPRVLWLTWRTVICLSQALAFCMR